METKQIIRRRRRSSALCKLAVAVAAVSVGEVSAWTTNPKAFRQQQQQQQRKQLPGMLPLQGPSQKPNLTSQNMLKTPGNPRVRNTVTTNTNNNNRQPRSLPKLSHSVLADCDTLPSFPTAHGLLSPETVMRLEELTRKGHDSDALRNFLDQYHRKGPLSCLTLLSDPEVLPHLTSALRDVTE